MSRDGLAMTGLDQFGGTVVRWTTTNPTPMVLAPGSMSITGAIDADGGVVVGQAISGQTAVLMRWSLGAGAQFTNPPAGYAFAGGSAVTADGSIVCGTVGNSSGTTSAAFRRGPSGVFEVLPVLAGYSRATVLGVSDDGATLVGSCNSSGPGAGAIWTGGSVAAIGPFLEARGLSTAGWAFGPVLGISGDGSVLFGNGTLNGQSQAWVAVIPAPGAGLLVATGLAAFRRRRRETPV